MRLSPEIATFIKNSLLGIAPESKVLLFGSRADDQAKGGDIDILWLTREKISASSIRSFKTDFYRSSGWQKIDIVNFLFTDEDPFKSVALTKSIEL